ncbi:MAG: Uma2 family endonuclease [Pyrinomonadaceae bacterium]
MAAKVGPLLTVADLDACPDDNNRYELIEGELFVSRAPGLPHQLILHRLQFVLERYLESNRIGVLVPGAGAVFSDYDAVIPDIVFIRNERWKNVTSEQRITGAPDIVIEILSPGSENRRRDLLVKRQLYAKYGVTEYWIVDTENRSVWVYRLQGQTLEETATLSENDEVTSPLLPGFHLTIGTIFKL